MTGSPTRVSCKPLFKKTGNFNYAVSVHIVFFDVISKQLALLYL